MKPQRNEENPKSQNPVGFLLFTLKNNAARFHRSHDAIRFAEIQKRKRYLPQA